MGTASVPPQSIAHVEWASVMKVEAKKGGLNNAVLHHVFIFAGSMVRRQDGWGLCI